MTEKRCCVFKLFENLRITREEQKKSFSSEEKVIIEIDSQIYIISGFS